LLLYFTSDVRTYIVLFLQNMELYLLNRHIKHCEKLSSDTVEYEGFLFMNHQVILFCMTAANPTYRTRHIDLYEQTLRMGKSTRAGSEKGKKPYNINFRIP